MITNQDILQELSDLKKPDFNVHVIDSAWYSVKSITQALTGKVCKEYPKVEVVRVGVGKNFGMLELHIREDVVNVLCYCCFSGNEEKGNVPLSQLKDLIISLKDHQCPPWPG